MVSEHGSAEKFAAFLAARGNVLFSVYLSRTCLPIGALRFLSLRDDLGLTFEDLAFRAFVNRDCLDVDAGKLLKTVLDKSQRHDPQLANKLKHDMDDIVSSATLPFELACGHDCIELLSFALRFAIGTRKPHEVTREVLERELRLAFSQPDWMVTALFGSIREWETANPGYRVVLE